MKRNYFSVILPSLILLFIGALFFMTPDTVSAFSLFPAEPSAVDDSADFRNYIVAFYNFALPATALVAVVLIMIGGIIWITSAGDQGRIAKAKEFIINPIIGIVLLASIYVVLGFINPNLVILQPIAPDKLTTPGACIISNEECKFVVDGKQCNPGRFVEGVSCSEAQELEDFEAQRVATEEVRREKFACEKDDQGHELNCSVLSSFSVGLIDPGQVIEIAYCSRFCRNINSSCRPSAAFGNDISCNSDTNKFKCFCKYDPPNE